MLSQSLRIGTFVAKKLFCPYCIGWMNQHEELHTWLKCGTCGFSELKCVMGHNCSYKNCQGSTKIETEVDNQNKHLMDLCSIAKKT